MEPVFKKEELDKFKLLNSIAISRLYKNRDDRE
jgi:hypothetical protein